MYPVQLADAAEVMLLSVLGPIVKCQWNLSTAEEAIITSVSVFFSEPVGRGCTCTPLFRLKLIKQ